MLFWLLCTIACLLIPLIMLFFGRRFLTKPPKNINNSYGYRTTRSMKNQETWDYAHHMCGKIWFWAGVIMLPLSLLAMLPAFGLDTDSIGKWCGGITLIQLVVLVASVFPVEGALKRKFDKYGRRVG